jgi:predicted ArsR family transcriptional regulator
MAKATPKWTFLTNHGQLLLCIAEDPGLTLREIGERIGITERAAHRIVAELEASGYLSRKRNGRRNHSTIKRHLSLPDSVARERQIGDLLGVLAKQTRTKGRAGHGEKEPDAPKA